MLFKKEKKWQLKVQQLVAQTQICSRKAAGKSYAVLTIMICNTEAPYPVHPEHGQTNFDLHFVKSGAAKANVNMVVLAPVLPSR